VNVSSKNIERDEVKASYPALYQFLGCSFHEDWYDEVTEPEERLVGGPEPEHDVFKRAVRAYAAGCSREEGTKALLELHRLLELPLPDSELRYLLSNGFGVNYWPGSEEAYRPWLQEVCATLEVCLRSAT
jgi:hypothetical protein